MTISIRVNPLFEEEEEAPAPPVLAGIGIGKLTLNFAFLLPRQLLNIRRSNPPTPSYYIDTVAAAYAEAGDFQSATQFEERALKAVHDPTRSGYEKRLALFQSHRPVRYAAR